MSLYTPIDPAVCQSFLEDLMENGGVENLARLCQFVINAYEHANTGEIHLSYDEMSISGKAAALHFIIELIKNPCGSIDANLLTQDEYISACLVRGIIYALIKDYETETLDRVESVFHYDKSH